MVKLPIEYSDKPVTPFAGMALMKRFIDQTGIREHLATLNLPQGGSNRAYDPVQVIESFWLGIWTGASRYIHCDWLRPGNTAACSNCVEFMRETFDEAMAGMKVGLDAFCLQDFWATEAAFRFIMVAYNLMSLFRHLGLNSHNQATLAALRSYGFAIGGWVSQHARKRVLQLSLPRKKRPWMDAIFRQIEVHPPPFAYSTE